MSGLPTNIDVKLQIQYTEEDCYRTRVQALLQHAAEIQVPIYDAEYDNPNSIGYVLNRDIFLMYSISGFSSIIVLYEQHSKKY